MPAFVGVVTNKTVKLVDDNHNYSGQVANLQNRRYFEIGKKALGCAIPSLGKGR